MQTGFILKDSEARELISLIYEYSGIVPHPRQEDPDIVPPEQAAASGWGCARSGNIWSTCSTRSGSADEFTDDDR